MIVHALILESNWANPLLGYMIVHTLILESVEEYDSSWKEYDGLRLYE